MPKIVVTPVPVNQDKYTRRVSVEMTEAEWEAFKGFAAAAVGVAELEERYRRSAAAELAAAKRAADGSLFYWNLDLDWDKLF